MICKHFIDNILKLAKFHSLPSVKWFQVFLSNTNNSIYYESIVCTQLNGYAYDLW